MMCTHAYSQGLLEYPEKDLAEAMYDILTVQFHEMLPGSSIQPTEEMGLRMLDHGLEILSRIKALRRVPFAPAGRIISAPQGDGWEVSRVIPVCA